MVYEPPRRFNPVWLTMLLTLPGDILAGFFLVGGPSLENVQWWRFAYLFAVYAALFLAGKAMASFRDPGPSLARGLCVAAMHGLGVVAGASFVPASIRLEGVPFPLHPPAVYLGAFAVALYSAASAAALCRACVRDGKPCLMHSLPFLSVLAGLGPAVVAWIPFTGEKPSPLMPLALFAFAIAALHALMLWRVYPRYAGAPALEARHLRNLMRVQAAVIAATVSGGAGGTPALAAALGVYALSSVFNWLYKPHEGPDPQHFADGADDATGGTDAAPDSQIR